MAKQTAKLVILCEDLQQAVFAKHFFKRHGFNTKKMRFEIGPKGKGAGEQYVRTQYAEEVKLYRRTSSYSPVGSHLIVVIDAAPKLTLASKLTVSQRLNQLDSALKDDGQPKRQANEKIAIFVPKRNIETWIHYLMGEKIDEERAYAKLARESDCKAYIKKLVEKICPLGLPKDAPLSLQLACDELQRIL